jgi:NitT/TauT family transport system permease protein
MTAADGAGTAAPTRARPVFRKVKRNRLREFLTARLQIVSLLTAATLWEILGQAQLFRFLPPISDVITSWFRLVEEGRLNAIGISLQSLAIGYSLALVLGLIVAVITTRWRTVDYVLDPYINTLMTTPTTALVPVLMLLFGLGIETRIVVIFLYTFFVIVVNAQSGFRSVNPSHVEMARAFGAGGPEILRRVIVPSSLPLLLTGIRLGMSRALRGMINAEVIISVTGIGALLIRYGRLFDMASLYAIILTIVGLAVIAVSIITLIEKRTLRWQR